MANPDYRGAFAFDNDFPALDDATHRFDGNDPLLKAESITGECRVLCYSENHAATLASLSTRELDRCRRTLARRIATDCVNATRGYRSSRTRAH